MSESRSFALFGGGGQARAVCDVVERAGGHVRLVVAPDIDGFRDVEHEQDDDAGVRRAAELGLCGLIGVGDQRTRIELADRASLSLTLPSIVARTATVAEDVELGPGTVVMEHAHIGPRARLGRVCVVNTGAVVEHDVVLEDSGFVAPGATLLGGVTCGRGVTVGAGATVLPGVAIGSHAVIGAGAVVRDDVAAGVVSVGVPARPLTKGEVLE